MNNRRLFLKALVTTGAVGLLAPEYLVRGRSMVSVPAFPNFPTMMRINWQNMEELLEDSKRSEIIVSPEIWNRLGVVGKPIII